MPDIYESKITNADTGKEITTEEAVAIMDAYAKATGQWWI